MKRVISLVVCLVLGCVVLTGCSNSGEPFEEKIYTPDTQVSEVNLNASDREIEVSLSDDEQVHIKYFESGKEYYDISVSDTIPVSDIQTDEVEFSHEAKIGKISDKTIFYLMSRGLSEEDALGLIVRGFVYPISKELPVEYAVEMNNLINLELEGAIG